MNSDLNFLVIIELKPTGSKKPHSLVHKLSLFNIQKLHGLMNIEALQQDLKCLLWTPPPPSWGRVCPHLGAELELERWAPWRVM